MEGVSAVYSSSMRPPAMRRGIVVCYLVILYASVTHAIRMLPPSNVSVYFDPPHHVDNTNLTSDVALTFGLRRHDATTTCHPITDAVLLYNTKNLTSDVVLTFGLHRHDATTTYHHITEAVLLYNTKNIFDANVNGATTVS